MKIKELAQKYNLGKDDFWELKRGARSMWIITHDAIERIAIIENIELTNFEILNTEIAFCKMLQLVGDAKRAKQSIFGVLVKHLPKNCKATYYVCNGRKERN